MFLQWLWFFVILGTFLDQQFSLTFLAENFFGTFTAMIETHTMIQQAHVAAINE